MSEFEMSIDEVFNFADSDPNARIRVPDPVMTTPKLVNAPSDM